MKQVITHEQYVHGIRQLVLSRLNEDEQAKLGATKLLYGAGHAARGVTMFSRWLNGKAEQIDIAQVCADGEENFVQVAGTTLHELAHVLAGLGAGHGGDWKEQAKRLGLRKALAAGQRYCMASFDPAFRFALCRLPLPTDGTPSFGHVVTSGGINLPAFKVRGCSIGIGRRGGKSRGAGSGSRLRKYQCDCGVIARVASDTFEASCNKCDTLFKQVIK